MIRTLLLAALLGLSGFTLAMSTTASAAEQAQTQTITLDVENMTCNMCPITVRKALEKVPGVVKAEAKYEGDGVGWAKVTFDPAKTDIDTLTNATFEAGYPSHIKK
ncbi:MAG: mercury resistance system periplasmic binding protein MerP [Gammaproteobacteria bacterium]|nr:mercury resistance system periplasmic binding protein MerP [Gammaproteobacteria bacterium]